MSKPSSARIPDAVLAIALGGLAVTVYALTAAPSVATIFDDSLEFQVVTFTLGIAHPTGYPLYTLLGRAFTLLPWGEPAFRTNLMSAFFGGVTVAALYLLCREMRCHRLAASAAALALAVSPVFWSQATIAEVYTLHAALMAVALGLALRVGEARGQLDLAYRRASLLAVVYGLSLTHHRMSLLLGPPLLVYLFWLFRWQLPAGKWLRLGLLVLAPLALYAYIPIRGLAVTSLDGSYLNTPAGFLRHITAAGYGVFLSGQAPGVLPRPLVGDLKLLLGQFGPLGLGLALVGLAALLRRPGARLLLGSSFLLSMGFALAYRVADYEVFFTPVFLLLAAFLGLGLDSLLGALLGLDDRATRWSAASYGLGLVAVAALLLPLPAIWREQDRHDDWAVHDLGLAWAAAAERDGAVVGILGETVLLRYFQVAHGLRPDLALYPADDESVRLATIRRLVAQGVPVYTTRSLPGLADEFALDAEGVLVRISPREADSLPSEPGRPIVPGLSVAVQRLEVGEAHGRSFVDIRLEWLATQPLERSYKVSARLLRGDAVLASVDAVPVHSTYPTTDWRPVGEPPREVVRDYYHVEAPGGGLGGPVEVLVIVYDAETVAEVARLPLGAVNLP